jgi:subtilisin family serine protease
MRYLIAVALLAVVSLAAAPAAVAQTNGSGNGRVLQSGGSNDRNLGASGRKYVAVTRQGRTEYVVLGPRDEASAAARALTAAGAKFLRQRDYPNLDRHALIFDLRGVPLDQARRLLAEKAPSTFADVHAIYRYAQGAPRLYAAALVGQTEGRGCTLPGSLRIGQIDGTVETSHPALRGADIVAHSVLAAGERSQDLNHGTSVAALLVGQDQSGALAGYATGARLFAATAFVREGRSDGADVERIGAALDWLIGNRVRVINMSFAGPVNRALDDLLGASAARGAVLIAAAGNGGSAAPVYPAAAQTVIAVTAIDARLRRYRAANTGPYIEFAAPGVDLYVATRNGGSYASGTSYAAPIISGLAARLSARGVSSSGAMRARLRAQAVDLGSGGRDTAFGWGLVKSSGC